MATLEKILRNQFGFKDSHFDENGHIYVNSMDGTISSMSKASAHLSDLYLRATDIFKVGHELRIRASGDSQTHTLLRILAINADGISAIIPSGEVGFFPWKILSFGISRPSQMEITPFVEARDTPLSTLRAAKEHLERRLVDEKAAVRITEEHLAAIFEQMEPSAQADLQGR